MGKVEVISFLHIIYCFQQCLLIFGVFQNNHLNFEHKRICILFVDIFEILNCLFGTLEVSQFNIHQGDETQRLEQDQM
jgi:hypothetical protein